MMKPNAIKFLRFYLLGDIAVIFLALFMGENWLINSQLAFLSSLIITFASFYSYQKMVQSRLDAGDIPEDKFEHLYTEKEDDDEDAEDDVQETKTPTPASSNIAFSFRSLLLSYKSALSLYRIAGYGVLFLVVLFLMRHERFEAVAFFVGLSVVPLISLAKAMMGKKGLE